MSAPHTFRSWHLNLTTPPSPYTLPLIPGNGLTSAVASDWGEGRDQRSTATCKGGQGHHQRGLRALSSCNPPSPSKDKPGLPSALIMTALPADIGSVHFPFLFFPLLHLPSHPPSFLSPLLFSSPSAPLSPPRHNQILSAL